MVVQWQNSPSLWSWRGVGRLDRKVELLLPWDKLLVSVGSWSYFLGGHESCNQMRPLQTEQTFNCEAPVKKFALVFWWCSLLWRTHWLLLFWRPQTLRAVVLTLQNALEDSRRQRLLGLTPRVSGSRGLGRAWESAWIPQSQLLPHCCSRASCRELGESSTPSPQADTKWTAGTDKFPNSGKLVQEHWWAVWCWRKFVRMQVIEWFEVGSVNHLETALSTLQEQLLEGLGGTPPHAGEP